MPRVKRGVMHAKRRKNLQKRTKGYLSTRKSTIKMGHQAILKAGKNAYVGRKLKKRTSRSLFTVRLNAAVREHGMTYSVFINALKKKNIILDRKVLSQMAANHPDAFGKLVAYVKA